jgi:hypothetical protein
MALLAARLGYDAVPVREDSPIMRTFRAGHRIEDEVLRGYPSVVDRQARVVLPISTRIVVVGHIDGHDVRLVEVKSQNRDEWDRFEREGWEAGFFPKYKWQVSSYMHATQRPLTLIRALRDEEGNWTGDKRVSYIDEPFYSIADIRERVLRVEAAAASGVLNAECSLQFPCPYFYLHDEIDRDLIADESVDILAREYAEASRDENVAKGRKKEAKRALREAVEKDRYETKTGVRVTFYTAKNPPQLDKEMMVGFLDEHKRTIDEFMVQGSSERIRVTLPREGEDNGVEGR